MSDPRPRSFRLEFSDQELSALHDLAARDGRSAASFVRHLIIRAADHAGVTWPIVADPRRRPAKVTRRPKARAKGAK